MHVRDRCPAFANIFPQLSLLSLETSGLFVSSRVADQRIIEDFFFSWIFRVSRSEGPVPLATPRPQRSSYSSTQIQNSTSTAVRRKLGGSSILTASEFLITGRKNDDRTKTFLFCLIQNSLLVAGRPAGRRLASVSSVAGHSDGFGFSSVGRSVSRCHTERVFLRFSCDVRNCRLVGTPIRIDAHVAYDVQPKQQTDEPRS